MDKITLEDLIEVAFAVEEGDPIDWGMFKQGKEEALKMIGTSIIEQFDKEQYSQQDKLILLSVITKLVTENMILHSKLMTLAKKNEV